MSAAASGAPPLWIHLLLAPMSAGLLVRRRWGAWSLALTIFAAPLALALTLIAESVAI